MIAYDRSQEALAAEAAETLKLLLADVGDANIDVRSAIHRAIRALASPAAAPAKIMDHQFLPPANGSDFCAHFIRLDGLRCNRSLRAHDPAAAPAADQHTEPAAPAPDLRKAATALLRKVDEMLAVDDDEPEPGSPAHELLPAVSALRAALAARTSQGGAGEGTT